MLSFFIQSVLKCHQQHQADICAHNRLVPEFSVHILLTYRPYSLKTWLWSGIPQIKEINVHEISQVLSANHLFFYTDHLKRDRDFLWYLRLSHKYWKTQKYILRKIFLLPTCSFTGHSHKISRGFLFDILVQPHWIT